MNIFLIILFGLAAVLALTVKTVVFHHFKKFSVPDDPFPAKILSIFKFGSIALIFISFIFLIILFL